MPDELLLKLEENLKSMREWERKPIVEVGSIVIELVKLPARQRKRSVEPEKLALHIRLRDSFRGIFIERYEELDDLMRALATKTVQDIARALEELAKSRKPIIEHGI
ncbi:MAG: hypothetical protein QXW41_09690 [Fervidicoccaceae archaeon]